MNVLKHYTAVGVLRPLRIPLAVFFAVWWGVAPSRGQTSSDVVQIWTSEVLRQATNKAEEAERATQISEQLRDVTSGGSLSPAEWPRAYAILLAQRAQALRALPSGWRVPSSDKELSERAAGPLRAAGDVAGTARSFREPEIAPLIRRILRREGLPEQLVAVALIESGFNPLAKSPKGARGLWQLMPDTARHFGLNPDGPFDERLDPVRSTVAAAQYLKQLYSRWGDWSLTLAAYNAGSGRVQEALARSGAQSLRTAGSLRLLPEETQQYVPKVLAAARRVSPFEAFVGRSVTLLGLRPNWSRMNAELREGGAP